MELAAPHELDVRVIGEDGAEIAEVQGSFQTTPGQTPRQASRWSCR